MFLSATTALLAAASAASIDPVTASGAWASAETPEACATAPISMFFSDGSVAVFESAAGSLHAIGVWRIDGQKLVMTHNDAPFDQEGAAKPPSTLDIVELTQTRFVTKNAEGKQRVRVRCAGLVLPHGAAERPH